MIRSLVVLLLAATAVVAGAEVRLRTGEIEGARFTLARPEAWNRNLLLLAHGLRPAESPLNAALDPHELVNARLLAEGWMVATTSYRRNGLVVRDAIADLNSLRDHVERTEGEPGLVILVGDSMGGAIVTLLAENEPDRFHGAVAIGAALHARDPVYPLLVTGAPKIPLLFLTNRSELEGPAAYVEAAAGAPVPPALWTVDRDGHVNVNDPERLAAIEALIGWITTDRIERRRDGTVALAPDSRSGAAHADGAAHGRAVSVTENHGNIFTNFTAADLERLGLARGDAFELVAGGRSWSVYLGSDYGDVAPGGWVAFLRAEGVLLLARNHEDAARTAGIAAGDPLVIRPRPPRP